MTEAVGRTALVLATGVFDKGGIARYTRYQIRALRAILGDAQVVTMSLLGPGGNDFEEPFPVTYAGAGLHLRDKVAFVRKVAGYARRLRPAIVWSNHVNFLPMAVPLARVARASLAVNVYGLELWSNRQWLHALTLPRADLVVPDCHFSAEYVTKRYGIPASRMRVVWDCVDTARFSPAVPDYAALGQYGVTPPERGVRTVLTLGRIVVGSEHKGYDRLIDAMIQLRDRPDVRCIIAGDGSDRARLEQRVRQAKLPDRVTFTGSIPEHLLVDLYNACDVFSLVSDRGPGRGEGIPLTPLEAAACGKPIIVGNEDGSQEAVVDGVTGALVSPRDPKALSRALLHILSDSERMRAMGLAARVRTEREFSYAKFEEKMARVLDDLWPSPVRARRA